MRHNYGGPPLHVGYSEDLIDDDKYIPTFDEEDNSDENEEEDSEMDDTEIYEEIAETFEKLSELFYKLGRR